MCQEVHATSIFKVKIEEAWISETLVPTTTLHSVATQKTLSQTSIPLYSLLIYDFKWSLGENEYNE